MLSVLFPPPGTRFYIRLCAHIYKTFLLPFSLLQNFHPISQACHFLAKFVSVYEAKRNTQPRLCVPTMTRPTSMVSRLPVLCMQTENVTSTTAQWPVRGTVNFKNDQSEATTCRWYASSFQFVDALRHRRSLTFYYSWNASNATEVVSQRMCYTGVVKRISHPRIATGNLDLRRILKSRKLKRK